MKNIWVTWLYGYVRIRVDGPYAERFLNRCIQHNLSIWDIKRISETSIVCYIALADIKYVKRLLKMADCKVTFIEKKGLPFLLRKTRLRSGFAGGILACIVILFVLSNVIWNIEIEGATPKVEHELRQIVNELGIKKGKFQFLLPSVDEVQKEVSDRLEGATWVGVTVNGTTYHFQVVEQKLPEKQQSISPRHLVASKKAIIHDVFVEQGQSLVRPNDFVQKGDLLVSGFIGKEGRTKLVPAKAQVFGEIWYKSTVTIPLKNSFESLTGDYKTTHFVTLFNVDIPVWGIGKQDFQLYETFENNKSFKFFKWTIPVMYKQKKVLEKKQLTREYTEEEAIMIGKEMAKKQMEKKLSEDSFVKGEKVLQQTVENDKVKLKIHYQVIEEITSELPIIQGD